MADPGFSDGVGGVTVRARLNFWNPGIVLMPIYEYIAYILCFVVRSENEIYIVHIAYKLQLNMCVLLCPNLQNRPKKKIKTGMG